MTDAARKNLAARIAETLSTDITSALYGYTQQSMAYHSNRIEGNILRMEQVSNIYRQQGSYPTGTKDAEETEGHFAMLALALRRLDEPLSEALVKNMHRAFSENIFEYRANGWPSGEYKTRPNRIGGQDTVPPEDVPKEMATLMNLHDDARSIEDLALLHAQFEAIYPFQDGNGRVGRAVLFRECLRHGLVPPVIRDRGRYLAALREAQDGDPYHLVRYLEDEQAAYADVAAWLLRIGELGARG